MNTIQDEKSFDPNIKHTFKIEILRDMTEEELQYIFDCWCEYWTNDFGYFPNEYNMILQ